MGSYLCTNNKGVRFTIKAANADDALDRAVKQFHLNSQYYTPIIASSITDPCDYKATNQIGGVDLELEAGVVAAVEALFSQ